MALRSQALKGPQKLMSYGFKLRRSRILDAPRCRTHLESTPHLRGLAHEAALHHGRRQCHRRRQILKLQAGWLACEASLSPHVDLKGAQRRAKKARHRLCHGLTGHAEVRASTVATNLTRHAAGDGMIKLWPFKARPERSPGSSCLAISHLRCFRACGHAFSLPKTSGILGLNMSPTSKSPLSSYHVRESKQIYIIIIYIYFIFIYIL